MVLICLLLPLSGESYMTEIATRLALMESVTQGDYLFEKQSIKLFEYQYAYNAVYREYIDAIYPQGLQVTRLEAIPFLPIAFFKNHPVKTGAFDPKLTFKSSGTGDGSRSTHMVKDDALYRRFAKELFETRFGPLEDMALLALLPNYLEAGHSSLVHMIDGFMPYASETSGYYLYDFDKLYGTIKDSSKSKSKICLFGVSYALLDFIENYDIRPFGVDVIVETGGMKGRKKEMLREELHAIFRDRSGASDISSEYGMTELLSQAYLNQDGRFTMHKRFRVLPGALDDPLSLASYGQTCRLNIIDLLNIDSCAFIATEDIGRVYGDGTFEVLGRMSQAEVRGCNLLYRPT